MSVATPFEADYARHVYHVYAIRVQERDEVRRYLEEKGVGCGVHYPIPIHLQEACRGLGYTEGAFPIAENLADEFLSLPMFPELTGRGNRICRSLRQRSGWCRSTGLGEKFFEDSRTIGSSGNDAALWRRFFCGTEDQREIAANANSRSCQRSGLGPCCCLASRCRLLPHQCLGKGASSDL